MSCSLSEEELWSGLDRDAPEIAEHVAGCTTCQARAVQIRGGIEAVAQATVPPTPPLPEKIGSYTIRRRLGHGGMGIVYEGEQEAPRRLVAIKVVRESLLGGDADEYRVRLFQREAQILARLKHPAIAAIYEGGRTGEGQHFFAMELVRGVPLNEYVRGRGLSRSRRLQLFRRICEAIHYAHLRGVIHRDLKPTNILVAEGDQPKILDFGLARITDADAAMTTTTSAVGRIMGTLAYMSPEEARGDPAAIDVRSDVYSLGVMFYELLTDRLPYVITRTALPEAVRVICEEPPRRPGGLDRSLLGDLETIALKALEKEPAHRFQSAAAFSDDIQRYLNDEPILARRAGPVYRFRKLVVRHKVFFVLLAGLVGLFAGGAFWLLKMEGALQASTRLTVDLVDRRVALLMQGLAHSHHELGQLDRAEQEYRTSLQTFERLEREDHSAKAKLGLAAVLSERGRIGDWEQAEDLLLGALEVFDVDLAKWGDERREALARLLDLYGPEKIDAPTAMSDLADELRAVDE